MASKISTLNISQDISCNKNIYVVNDICANNLVLRGSLEVRGDISGLLFHIFTLF